MPKMKFSETMFVNGQVFANPGQIVEVGEASVNRWIIRGGQVVDDTVITAPKTEKVEEPKKEEQVKTEEPTTDAPAPQEPIAKTEVKDDNKKSNKKIRGL